MAPTDSRELELSMQWDELVNLSNGIHSFEGGAPGWANELFALSAVQPDWSRWREVSLDNDAMLADLRAVCEILNNGRERAGTSTLASQLVLEDGSWNRLRRHLYAVEYAVSRLISRNELADSDMGQAVLRDVIARTWRFELLIHEYEQQLPDKLRSVTTLAYLEHLEAESERENESAQTFLGFAFFLGCFTVAALVWATGLVGGDADIEDVVARIGLGVFLASLVAWATRQHAVHRRLRIQYSDARLRLSVARNMIDTNSDGADIFTEVTRSILGTEIGHPGGLNEPSDLTAVATEVARQLNT